MIRRLLTLLAVTGAALLVLPASPASAHAFLTSSNPADGAVLSTAPEIIRLSFSESVVLSATHIDLVDSDGRHYPVRDVRLIGGDEGDIEDPVQIVASLPALPYSAYRVSWQTLSSDDLHRTSGLLVFGIGRSVTAIGQSEPAPRGDEAMLRWVLFGGLALSLGGLLSASLLRRAGGDARPAARLSGLGAVGGGVAAIALLVDQWLASGSPLADVLSGSYGIRWLVREAGFALLVAAAVLAHRAAARRWRTAVTAAGVACACYASALLGHSGRTAVSTRMLADTAHLAAGATWAGALLVFVALWRTVKPSRAVLRSFAVYGAACASVVLVTGIYLASDVVGSIDAALLTTYGRTLLIKVAVVGVVAGLALLNHRRVRRRRGRLPARTVAAEAGAATIVLGLAALLTSGQPAREPQFVASPRVTAVQVVAGTVDDLQQALSIGPNRPGRNVVTVSVFDTRRPAPAPIRRVEVSVIGLDGRGTGARPAERLADGRWSAPVDLVSPGRIGVEVRVLRAGLPDATHVYRWTVGGAASQTQSARVSTAPAGGPLRLLAVVMAAMLVLAWIAFLTRRATDRTAARSVVPGDAQQVPELVEAGTG